MRGHKRQRGPNTWRLFVDAGSDPISGRRRQRTKTFHGTERAADTALANFVAEADAGRLGDVATITVTQLLEQWYKQRVRDWEPNTARGYRSKINTHITPTIGAQRIARITSFDCDQLYQHLRANGQSPNSIRRVHAIIHTAFAQAVRWGWLQRNPATNATPPTVDAKEPDDLSPELVAKAIAAAPSPLREIARLAAITGAREAELCGLRWTDLDTTARTLRIQRRCVTITGGYVIRPLTKTRTLRAVGLDRHTIAILRLHHYKARRRARACGIELPADAYIFSETPDGTPIGPNVVGQRWSRHRTRLGLTLTFHELRHFNASLLLDAGFQLGRVSGRLGHARHSTTSDVYTHLMRATDHDMADGIARHID